jgi:hypothetical protein
MMQKFGGGDREYQLARRFLFNFWIHTKIKLASFKVFFSFFLNNQFMGFSNLGE